MYVRDPCWRVPALYGSAIDAWNGARHKHPNDRNPPVGAPCYYRGGQYGHAVISVGGGKIRSTDCHTAWDVSEVPISWVESSWGYAYLGWTEDLNAVVLPIDGGTTDGGDERDEDMPENVKALAEAMSFGDWKTVTWGDVVNDSAGDTITPGNPGIVIPGSHYVATITATVTPPEGAPASATIRTRTIEGDLKNGVWTTTESNPPKEHPVTSGDSFVVDTRAGRVSEGVRLRVQIAGPDGCQLRGGTVHVLYW
jgi:hypothetical protein